MRTLLKLAVLNPDGSLFRVTSVPEKDAELQITAPGQTLRLATVLDEQDLATKRAQIASHLSNLRASAEPDERDVLIEALKKKHGLTADDLAAARERVRGKERSKGI